MPPANAPGDLFTINGHPDFFFVHPSIQLEEARRHLRIQIRAFGGKTLNDPRVADVILINALRPNMDLDTVRASYNKYSDSQMHEKWVYHMDKVQHWIGRGVYEHILPVKKKKKKAGLPVKGIRIPYTPEDEDHLCRWLGEEASSSDPRGLTGNNVYKFMMDCYNHDPNEFSWVIRHTWQSWRNHYKHNRERLNVKIEEYKRMFKENRQNAEPRARKPEKRQSGGRAPPSQYEEEEEEEREEQQDRSDAEVEVDPNADADAAERLLSQLPLPRRIRANLPTEDTSDESDAEVEVDPNADADAAERLLSQLPLPRTIRANFPTEDTSDEETSDEAGTFPELGPPEDVIFGDDRDLFGDEEQDLPPPSSLLPGPTQPLSTQATAVNPTSQRSPPKKIRQQDTLTSPAHPEATPIPSQGAEERHASPTTSPRATPPATSSQPQASGSRTAPSASNAPQMVARRGAKKRPHNYLQTIEEGSERSPFTIEDEEEDELAQSLSAERIESISALSRPESMMDETSVANQLVATTGGISAASASYHLEDLFGDAEIGIDIDDQQAEGILSRRSESVDPEDVLRQWSKKKRRTAPPGEENIRAKELPARSPRRLRTTPARELRKMSVASSADSFPIAGTRASAMKKQLKQKETNIPYTPPIGTRARAVQEGTVRGRGRGRGRRN